MLVVYFALIKPNSDKAANAVIQGEKQVQQAVQNVNEQTGGAVPASVQNLTACMAAAGTDTDKIRACQAKFNK